MTHLHRQRGQRDHERSLTTTHRRIATGILVLVVVVFVPLLTRGPYDPLRFGRQMYRLGFAASGGSTVSLTPELLQKRSNDCSVSVIRALYVFSGLQPPTTAALERQLKLRADGVTLDQLAASLHLLGWRATVVRQSELARPRPFEISLLRSAHFVLVLATTDSAITLFDPLVGVARLPVASYRRRWTGKSVQLFGRTS